MFFISLRRTLRMLLHESLHIFQRSCFLTDKVSQFRNQVITHVFFLGGAARRLQIAKWLMVRKVTARRSRKKSGPWKGGLRARARARKSELARPFYTYPAPRPDLSTNQNAQIRSLLFCWPFFHRRSSSISFALASTQRTFFDLAAFCFARCPSCGTRYRY